MDDYVTLFEEWRRMPDGRMRYRVRTKDELLREVWYEKGKEPLVIMNPEVISVKRDRQVPRWALEDIKE